jgi:hypothetical protein
VWITTIAIGYTNSTGFIVPTSGWYLVSYKLDIRSGGTNTTINSDCSAVLTQNGTQITGSTTLIEAPEAGHIYSISNNVLVNLVLGDEISLLFWSNDLNTQIGDPTYITGLLPNSTVPTETTASIVFTKIA